MEFSVIISPTVNLLCLIRKGLQGYEFLVEIQEQMGLKLFSMKVLRLEQECMPIIPG